MRNNLFKTFINIFYKNIRVFKMPETKGLMLIPHILVYWQYVTLLLVVRVQEMFYVKHCLVKTRGK